MIRGIHGLLYTSEADAMRAFIRDKLRLPYTDVGGGWLIFDLPQGDLGVHPIDDSGEPPSGTHDVSFFCDDIHGTVAELRSRGVRFDGDIADHGYGLVTYLTMPGGVKVQLYEPKYRKRSSSPKPKSNSKGRSKTPSTAPRARSRSKRSRVAGKRRRR